MVEFLNSNSPFSISEGIYYILVASLGIPSNLLSIVVLCTQRCGVSRSTVIYLVSLAVVDTIFMVLGGLLDVGASWWESVTSQAPSALLCNFVSFNEQWTVSSAQWIVTAFTLERYLVCRGRGPRPCLCCRLSRPRRALLVALVSVLGSQALSLPCCWRYRARAATGGEQGWTSVSLLWRNVSRVPLVTRCQALHSPSLPAVVWSYLLLSSWLPMTLTLSLSVLVSLHFHRRARALVAPLGGAPFRDAGSRMRRTGRIQVVVALVMVFLNLPHYVTQGILAGLWEQVGLEGALGVAVAVSVMLQWLSMVSHFLLYCFLSSGFRRETLALLRRVCRVSAAPAEAWSGHSARRSQAPPPPRSQVWLVQEVLDDHRKWQS
ncbi:probable G-protein coupled receptor 139 [Conger conger]|uniref:probable G-protein coupled receptor 139 n=1 Tax=Conger conger TaxID=82655 RepID=UPI002A5A3FCD|nr:probable G-protein coupled receptor 139 [Conger conger]